MIDNQNYFMFYIFKNKKYDIFRYYILFIFRCFYLFFKNIFKDSRIN